MVGTTVTRPPPPSAGPPRVEAVDWLIFGGLETLGLLAIVGNLSLIVVLLRNKYLNRPSFILMLSLAIADVMHGLVTTCYFYPPIVLKYTHMPELGIRLYNVVDWTAWSITLTHMLGICLDRLIAIMLYGRYNVIVTIPRVRNYSLCCWFVFLVVNTAFFFFDFCCLIRPLEEQNYYTFGYIKQGFNVYVLAYTPLEIITICVLTVSNPITLIQLYRRHKRKVALRMQGAQKYRDNSSTSSVRKAQRSQWQRASTMLLEMSMKMGQKHVTNDVRELAARRANRQQQRILLQITVVALIFYAYMTAYYMSFYIAALQSTAVMVFNSFFYSTTHMINPVIYFSLNAEMRQQLWAAVLEFFAFISLNRRVGEFESRMNSQYNNHTSTNTKTTSLRQNNRCRDSEPTLRSATTLTESSPLFSSGGQYKSMSNQMNSLKEILITESFNQLIEDLNNDEAQIIVVSSRRESVTIINNGVANKVVPAEEKTALLDGLIRALQASESRHSVVAIMPADEGKVRRWPFTKQSHSLDIPSGNTGRYVRVSTTTHALCETPAEKVKGKTPDEEDKEMFTARASKSMQQIVPPQIVTQFSSVYSFPRRKKEGTTSEDDEEEEEWSSPKPFTGSSSSMGSPRQGAWTATSGGTTHESLTHLLQHVDSAEDSDEEDDIAYL